jgi:homoserine O-acetyltransferase/O-succinyltransferase
MTYSFRLQNFELQCGRVLPAAELIYETYGELRPDRRNVVLYPTSYGAQHIDIDWLIRPNGILDAQRWFVVIPNMFGNGFSSSPSNSADCGLLEQGFWFTHWDNVRAQEIMLREVFGIDRLALVYGWSMGAQQAYHWGALYPEQVDRIAALCGTARTTAHNRIFLESLRLALTSDQAWTGDGFAGTPDRGIRTFARIYASWAASQAFYREEIYLQLGYSSLDDYLRRGWEAGYRRRDPHNLICDISDNPLYEGDYAKALGAIRARTLVMPATTDLYFTPEDCQAEAALIPRSQYLPIPSIWGHRAGNPYQNPVDEAFIRTALGQFLDDN